MFKLNFIIASFIFLTSANATSQHVYSNTFDDCNIKVVSLENDITTAKKSNDFISSLIASELDSKTLKKLSGVLKIQVLAYPDNSTCLYSYENETNLKDEELNLAAIKKAVDNKMIWDNVAVVCSPLIECYFKNGKVTIKRIGMNGNIGYHELKAK